MMRNNKKEACKREIPWFGDNCLDLARTLAQRSDCLRRQYGCVIVKDGRIVSTGFNSAPYHELSCYVKGNCARKECKHNSGSYDECSSVHAEQQALINADPRDLDGSTVYLVGFENGVELTDVKPCPICKRMLYFAKIKSIITNSEEMRFTHESYH